MDYLFAGILPPNELDEERARKLETFYRAHKDELQVLVRSITGVDTWVDVPPVPTRAQVVRDMHQSLGHLGRDKLMEALREWYWWPGMHLTVAECLAYCETCQKDKGKAYTTVPLQETWKGTAPF